MRALAASGDQAGALAAYDALRRQLAEQLGIDPSQPAVELHLRLLRGELAADAASADRGRAGPADAARSSAPFVGRDRELDRMSGLGHDCRVALVAGRSGSGKSRLLAELAARADRSVLPARALLPEREAPWSLARRLLGAAVDIGVATTEQLPPRSVAALAQLCRVSGRGISPVPETGRPPPTPT